MEPINCSNGHQRSDTNTYWYKGKQMCKTCRNENAKSFRRKHRKKVNEWHQENYKANSSSIIEYKKKYRAAGRHKNAQYNLKTPYLDMVKEQDNKCAICSYPPQEGDNLAVDHDHKCCPSGSSCGNCVRKLLCIKCNAILGLSNDSSEILSKAINYLENHKMIKKVTE